METGPTEGQGDGLDVFVLSTRDRLHRSGQCVVVKKAKHLTLMPTPRKHQGGSLRSVCRGLHLCHGDVHKAANHWGTVARMLALKDAT